MTAIVDLSCWLVARGLTPQQADLWGDFIIDALDLLEDGHALLRTPAEWPSFLGGCHGTRPTEPEITSGLGDRMDRLRCNAPIGSRRDRIQVSYEAPTPGDHSHGIRKSKADFRFVRKYEAGRAMAFVLEAKPLHANADLTSRYLGLEGMGCFTHRTPAYSEDLAVGMVGYMRIEPPTWAARLTTALEASLPLRFDQVQTGRRISLTSDHERVSGALTPVTVIHTLLDFTELQ